MYTIEQNKKRVEVNHTPNVGRHITTGKSTTLGCSFLSNLEKLIIILIGLEVHFGKTLQSKYVSGRINLMSSFFLFSFTTHAQLTDDSLKNICKSIPVSFRNEEIKKGNLVNTNCSEIFNGTFQHSKVFEVSYDVTVKKNGKLWTMEHNSFYKIFSLNIFTGHIVDLLDYEKFNKDISDTKKFTTLDKAYLYLIVNGYASSGVTLPFSYRRRVRKKMIINSYCYFDNMNLFNHGHDPDMIPEYQKYINKSNKRDIYIGVQGYRKDSRVISIYNVKFDKLNNIINFQTLMKDCELRPDGTGKYLIYKNK